MLKYYNTAVTFAEFPDEIALCVNISKCPGHCKHCSEPWLLEDVGTPMTNEVIQSMIEDNPNCTVFGIMGGDADHIDVARIADYVRGHSAMKVGVYSGMDSIDLELVPHIDFYKIGRWIVPEGDPETWPCHSWGPLVFPFSNQVYFEKKDGKLINATEKFRRHSISSLDRYIHK